MEPARSEACPGRWWARERALLIPAPVFRSEAEDSHGEAGDHQQAGQAGGDSPAQGGLAGGVIRYGEAADSTDDEAADVGCVVDANPEHGKYEDKQYEQWDELGEHGSQPRMALLDEVDENQPDQSEHGARASNRHMTDEVADRFRRTGWRLLPQQDRDQIAEGFCPQLQGWPGVARYAASKGAQHVDREELGLGQERLQEAAEGVEGHAVDPDVPPGAMEEGAGDKPPVFSVVDAAAMKGAKVQ